MEKIIFIIIAIFLFAFVIGVFFCACIIAGSFDNEDYEEEIERENKELKHKKYLCPVCKTGKESYEIDNLSDVCPYIEHLKDGKCKYFVHLD